MKRIISVCACFCIAAYVALSADPVVNVLSVTQDSETKNVTVTYSLTGADAIVTLDVLTNGVSVGGVSCVAGDANHLVAADGDAVRKIVWVAAKDRPETIGPLGGTTKVKVQAWLASAPPPYICIDLMHTNIYSYYAGAYAVPGGVTNNLYKTEQMLMRRIPAKNKRWRIGSGNDTGDFCSWYVTLTNDYYIGVYPVTSKQQQLVVEKKQDFAKTVADYTEADMKPIVSISWQTLRGSTIGSAYPNAYDATHTRNDVDSGSRIDAWRKFTGLSLDLPTDAQWEFAGRAGTSGSFYNGANSAATLDPIAWTEDNANSVTQMVGLKLPNNFGLYDMIGNCYELCLDWLAVGAYDDANGTVVTAGGDVTDPLGPVSNASQYRSRRSGSCAEPWNAGYQKVFTRVQFLSVSQQNVNTGYRLALTLP